MALHSKILMAALLCVSPIGCGGSTSSANSPEAAIAQTSNQLQGSWLLVEFHPEEQLEPVLGSLLAVQMGHLTVTLDRGNMTVQGVGVNAQRQYTVDTASAQGFTMTIVDPVGVKYGLIGGFQGPEVVFSSQTSPWRGSGRLRRTQ